MLQVISACVKLSLFWSCSCFTRTFHGFTRTFHGFLPVPSLSCSTTRCNLVVSQCLSYSEAQEGLVELHLKCELHSEGSYTRVFFCSCHLWERKSNWCFLLCREKVGTIGLSIILVLHGLFRGEEKHFVKTFRSDLLLVCSCA